MDLIIQTPTPNLVDSQTFYSNLGFTPIVNSNCFTDGKSIIEIDTDRFSRPGIKLYANSWKEKVAELQKITKVVETKNGYLLGDTSGTWIYLIESDNPIAIPDNCKNSMFGNNHGVSIETVDIETTSKIWNNLGFTTKYGSPEQGWISMASENGISINLMTPNSCPHLFLNPSISFFNGANNPEIIQKIRATGIQIKEEITHFNENGEVDNIIMSDPGNIGFFIFND